MRAVVQRVSEASVTAGDAATVCLTSTGLRIDVHGRVLAVSQFTLAAQGMESGNRPGFSAAAPPEEGRRLYEHFCETLRREGIAVETGVFGAEMKVSLVNDGPVTILFDTAAKG